VIADLPGCGQPAAARIEAYSPAGGRAHGSLDLSLYTCAEHTDQACEVLAAAGCTPYRVPGCDVGVKRCGDGMDFTGERIRPLTAPGGAP
jgi:hypothetical protein